MHLHCIHLLGILGTRQRVLYVMSRHEDTRKLAALARRVCIHAFVTRVFMVVVFNDASGVMQLIFNVVDLQCPFR